VLLQRRGHAAQLRIGILRDGTGPLRGHAWIESEGATLVGGGATAFFPLVALEGSPRGERHE
jgi:hypothetical protein